MPSGDELVKNCKDKCVEVSVNNNDIKMAEAALNAFAIGVTLESSYSRCAWIRTEKQALQNLNRYNSIPS